MAAQNGGGRPRHTYIAYHLLFTCTHSIPFRTHVEPYCHFATNSVCKCVLQNQAVNILQDLAVKLV